MNVDDPAFSLALQNASEAIMNSYLQFQNANSGALKIFVAKVLLSQIWAGGWEHATHKIL
jgi:hypothetical protein